MCKWGTLLPVNVIRRSNPFVADGWHQIYVDSCIANLVQKLNDQGIITRQSCCGHGNQALAEIWIAEESIEKTKELGYQLEKRADPDRFVIVP